MSKQIAVVVDIDRRVVIGASRDQDGGVNVVYLPEGCAVVVTCAGEFSWRCVEMAQIKEEMPAQSPETQKGDSNG